MTEPTPQVPIKFIVGGLIAGSLAASLLVTLLTGSRPGGDFETAPGFGERWLIGGALLIILAFLAIFPMARAWLRDPAEKLGRWANTGAVGGLLAGLVLAIALAIAGMTFGGIPPFDLFLMAAATIGCFGLTGIMIGFFGGISTRFFYRRSLHD